MCLEFCMHVGDGMFVGSEHLKVWPCGWWLRGFAFVYLGGFLAIVCVDLIYSQSAYLAALCVAAVGLIVLWLVYFRPRVILAVDYLQVVNPFSSTRIELSSIVALEPGWSGLEVVTAERTYRAWAVQQPNLHSMFGKESRSDRVVAEIARMTGRDFDSR